MKLLIESDLQAPHKAYGWKLVHCILRPVHEMNINPVHFRISDYELLYG